MEDADNVVVATQATDTEMKDETTDTATAPEAADVKDEVKKREEESPIRTQPRCKRLRKRQGRRKRTI